MSRKGHLMTSLEACAKKVAYPANYLGKEAAAKALTAMQAKYPESTQGLVMYQCSNTTSSARHLHLGRHGALR
jgi:hypothetical protein